MRLALASGFCRSASRHNHNTTAWHGQASRLVPLLRSRAELPAWCAQSSGRPL